MTFVNWCVLPPLRAMIRSKLRVVAVDPWDETRENSTKLFADINNNGNARREWQRVRNLVKVNVDRGLGDKEQAPLERVQNAFVRLHRALDGVALVVAAESAGQGDLLVGEGLKGLNEDLLGLALHGLADLVLVLALIFPVMHRQYCV